MPHPPSAVEPAQRPLSSHDLEALIRKQDGKIAQAGSRADGSKMTSDHSGDRPLIVIQYCNALLEGIELVDRRRLVLVIVISKAVGWNAQPRNSPTAKIHY